MVTLTIQLPGSSPVTHVLKDDTITIGRMAGNTIVINDSSVSLMHARITKKGGEFFLKDLNSTNGTLVNGQPVTEAKLRDRDAVRFADISGQFNAEATAPEAAAAKVLTAAPVSAAVQAPPPRAIAPSQPSPVPAAREQAPARPNPWSSIVPAIAGGVAALCVVSFLGWNLLHQKNEKAEPATSQSSIPAPQAKAPAKVAAREVLAAAPLPAQTAAPSFPPGADASAVDQPAPDLPQLIKTLQDPDPAARRQAVATLHSMGPDAASATPALHQALSDPDQEVRLWAALTLINNKSYDKAIPPILLHELHDEKPMLRQLACVSLGLLPYEPAEKQTVVPALVVAANSDTDEDVRKAATSALGVIDPDGSTKATIK